MNRIKMYLLTALMALGLGSVQAQSLQGHGGGSGEERMTIEEKQVQLLDELTYLNSIDKSELSRDERKALKKQKNSVRNQLAMLDRMDDPYRYDRFGRRVWASPFFDPYGVGFVNPYRFRRPVVIVRRNSCPAY